MSEKTKNESYSAYKERVLAKLVKQIKTWEGNGVYKRNGDNPKAHILPLSGENTRENRAKAIKEYLGFDCKPFLEGLTGLHQYAHHLNSSQTACLMFSHN